MKLSTKGRYAVTAMMDLAIHEKYGPVTLADISQIQGISLSYLEQLFANLRRKRLVEGTRGPGGGYRLGRPASDITIAEIVTAVDERLDTTRCAGQENCQEGERCLAHDLWTELSDQIYDFLNGITLAEFVERQNVQARVEQQDLVHGRAGHRRRPAA